MKFRDSSAPRPWVCYLAVAAMLVVLPIAAYTDPGHALSVIEITLRSMLVLAVCLLPLAYFATRCITVHSILCAMATLCLLCLALVSIKAGVGHATEAQVRSNSSR